MINHFTSNRVITSMFPFLIRNLLLAIWLIVIVVGCQEAMAEIPATNEDTLIFDDQFETLRPGPLMPVVGPHSEYHYLPEAVRFGPWSVTTFDSASDTQTAWRSMSLRDRPLSSKHPHKEISWPRRSTVSRCRPRTTRSPVVELPCLLTCRHDSTIFKYLPRRRRLLDWRRREVTGTRPNRQRRMPSPNPNCGASSKRLSMEPIATCGSATSRATTKLTF